MASLLNIIVTRDNQLGQIADRLDDPRELHEANLFLWRSFIFEEFTKGGWFRPQGGVQSWPKTKPFGNRQAPLRTLVRSGRLLGAWMGRGPGSIERVTEDGFEFGVDTNALPYAPVHRPSEPSATAFGQVTKIFVRRRQRIFLGLQFGVWLRRSTRFLRVPARPHATSHPRAVESMVRNALHLIRLEPLDRSA